MVSSKYYAPIGQTSSEILATKLILKKKITELFLVTLFRIGFFICSLGQLYLKVCSASFHSFKVKCGMRWIFGIKFTKFLLKYLS